MKPMIIIGALAALGTGITIGTQSAISGRVGTMIGPMRTGLISNIFSGVSAGLITLVLVLLYRAGASGVHPMQLSHCWPYPAQSASWLLPVQLSPSLALVSLPVWRPSSWDSL